MPRILASCVFHSFRHLACRYGISVYLNSSCWLLWRFKHPGSICKLYPKELYLMAGILPFKHKRLMLRLLFLLNRNRKNPPSLFGKRQGQLLSIQNTAHIIIPICPMILYMELQLIPCKTQLHPCTRINKNRIFLFTPVDSSTVR